MRDQAAKSFLHNLLLFELFDLSRKTGLVIRLPDSAEMETLFAELEKFNGDERAQTFAYLKRALTELAPRSKLSLSTGMNKRHCVKDGCSVWWGL